MEVLIFSEVSATVGPNYEKYIYFDWKYVYAFNYLIFNIHYSFSKKLILAHIY